MITEAAERSHRKAGQVLFERIVSSGLIGWPFWSGIMATRPLANKGLRHTTQSHNRMIFIVLNNNV